MTTTTSDDHQSQQRPEAGGLVLDHLANFVPDMSAAERDLERLGFTLTPLSHQMHRTSPETPLVSAGTANRTAMLERGYLEFLTTTGDTPNADKLKAAMARYTGAHLVCFGTTQPDKVHARLAAQHFDPPPVVALQRDVETESGARATARFSVCRAAPEKMPEGRIQFVEHHTPALIWQKRWLSHANGARGLAAVVVAVADIDEASTRWRHFTGLAVRATGELRVIATARGQVILGTAAAVEQHFGIKPPQVPWIGGAILAVADPRATRRVLDAAGAKLLRETAGRIVVAAPPSIGGILGFQRQA
jgi:hypothetical protein